MPACYNPKTGKTSFQPSAYEAAHEYQHSLQHDKNGRLWRFWERTHKIPIVGGLATLAIEVDAAGRALAALPPDADHRNAQEAAAGLVTYIAALTVLPMVLGWGLILRARTIRRKSTP